MPDEETKEEVQESVILKNKGYLNLPEELNISIVRHEDAVDISYVEKFHDKRILRATRAMLQPLIDHIGLTLIWDEEKNLIGYKGQLKRETFGNMMITEFMMWGTLGDTTLRDFFGIMATMALAGMQDKEKFKETLDNIAKEFTPEERVALEKKADEIKSKFPGANL